MKQKLLFLSILMLLLGSGLRSWGQTNPGDIAFIAANADGDDDFAFVTLVDIPANANIYFTDNEWNGSAFADLNEGELTWTNGASILNAGSIVVFTDPKNASTRTVNVGSVSGTGWDLGSSDEWCYALMSAPATSYGSAPVFLAALASDAGSGWLTNTGLTEGTSAIDFNNDYDGFEYTGSTSGQSSFSNYLSLIYNASNWTNQASDGELILPISTTAFTITGTGANSITTGAVATTPFCVTASTGAAGTVAYTSSGTFTGTFTAQLSDASGSFVSATAIGTGASPISITIPAGTVSGTGYKIRVVNDNPATSGSESAAFSVINSPFPVTSVTATPSNGQIILNWTNPTGCFDKVIVIGKQGSAVNSDFASVNLNGVADGSDFTSANSDWSSRSDINDMFNLTSLGIDNEDYLLYNGNGSSATITGVTNGIVYHFRILVVKDNAPGSLWSSGTDVNATPAVLPSLTEIIVPQFIQGMNGTNNNRIPFAYRVQLNDLSPNTTYRYINQVINSGDGAAISGAGNAIFVKQSGDFVRTIGPSLSTSNNYGEFTTNESGSFTGWFITEPTANARFTPGQTIWMRIILNNGAGGTTAVTYLTTTNSTVVVNFGTTASASEGSALYGTSFATSKDFVFLYDNTSGTGRPMCGSFVESDGVDLSAVTSIAQFYKDHVDGQGGYWGTIIPNVNANGIRRIEYRHLSNGNLFYAATDNDGNWNGLNTVNPIAGATALEVSDNVVDDFTIGTSSSIYLPATFNLTISGTLTNNAGSAGLVIESDDTGTGSLLHNTADVPATVQRYITGNSNLTAYDYHLVSVPLDAAVTTAQFTGSYLYYFDPVSEWQSMGTSTTTPVPVDKGYMIYYPEASTTYDFVGELNNGTFTASTPMTATGQFALVPNPYPSAIDWDAASGWTRTNLLNAIWIWDPANDQYAAYGTQAGTNGGTKNIPVGQAFFVKSNAAAPVLTMNNNVRLHHIQDFWKEGETEKDLIRVKAYGNGMSDEILVRFRDYGQTGFDATDVDKLNGSDQAPQLHFLSSDQRALCINTLPYSTETVTVDMGMQLMADGTVTLVFSGFEFFEAGAAIFLEDLLTGQMTDLRANPTYAFEHSQGNDPLRFRMHFMGVTSTGETAENELKVWNSADRIFFSLPESEGQQAVVDQIDLLGRVIESQQISLGAVNSTTAAAKGIILHRVTIGNKVYTNRLFIR